MTCNFPYIGHKCNTTWADFIGKEFYYYHGAYLATVILTLMYSLLQTTRVVMFTNPERYHFQKLINCMALLTTVFLVVQASDPSGYTATIEPLAEVLISDLVAALCLVLLFIFIIEFCKITVNNNDFLQGNKTIWERYFWSIAGILTLILALVFGSLQVYNSRELFRGIKLILYAIVILVATIRADYLLYVARQQCLQQAASTLRIDIYASLFNFFLLFVVIYQLVIGAKLVMQQATSRKPEITSDMIILPLCEIVGLLMTIAFTSKFEFDQHETPFYWISTILFSHHPSSNELA